MLRVQRMWWSAGLRARVDHEHLQGADPDLAPVRDCATAVVGWIGLRCRTSDWRLPDPMGWTLVGGNAAKPGEPHGLPGSTADWIGGQLRYFWSNIERREERVRIADVASWHLFATSGALAAILWLWFADCRVRALFEHVAALAPAGPRGAFLIWLVPALLAVVWRIADRDVPRGWAAMLLTILLSLAAAAALAL